MYGGRVWIEIQSARSVRAPRVKVTERYHLKPLAPKELARETMGETARKFCWFLFRKDFYSRNECPLKTVESSQNASNHSHSGDRKVTRPIYNSQTAGNSSYRQWTGNCQQRVPVLHSSQRNQSHSNSSVPLSLKRVSKESSSNIH